MKSALRVIAAIVVLVLAYLIATFAVGRVMVSETKRFAEELAQRDGVVVHRLDYEAGLFNGVLRYDLEYQVLPGSLLAELTTEVPRLNGQMEMRHGPWVGDGFALAAGDGAVAVPEYLRGMLPELAPSAVLLDTRLRAGFDRTSRFEFEGMDYAGKVVSPGEPDGTLKLAGTEGWVEFDAELSVLRFDVNIGEWRLSAPEPDPVDVVVDQLTARADLERVGNDWVGDMEMGFREVATGDGEADMRFGKFALRADAAMRPSAAEGQRVGLRMEFDLASAAVQGRGNWNGKLSSGTLSGEADIVEEWPQVWTGRSEMVLNDVQFGEPDALIGVTSIRIDADGARKGEVYDQTSVLTLGPMSFKQSKLSGGEVVLTLQGIDGQALSDVTLLQGSDDPRAMAVLQEAARAIMAGQPRIAIDRAGLNVLKDNDVSAHAAFSFNGEPGVDPTDANAWIERSALKAGLSARLDAVQELIRLVTEAEAVAQAPSGVAPNADEITRQANARYFDFVSALRQSPYVVLTADALQTEVAYAGGKLTINGVESDPLALFGLAASIALPSLGGDDDEGASLVPDISAPAQFARLSLTSGFTPAPRTIDLVAGGGDLADGMLGPDCIGYIDATRPDVMFDYAGGEAGLALSATSEGDTALIVHGPDGSWHCNDDRDMDTLDPEVRFPAPAAGTYRIWVANLDPEQVEAELSIEEVR